MNFRLNVAIIVLNDEGEILVGERSDVAGAWQLPQGGVEEGESLEEAMLRELREEIGTDDVEILEVLPQKIRYEWPEEHWRGGYHGQEQTYYAVRLSDDSLLADQTEEFQSFRWMSKDEFLTLTNDFKKEAYKRALTLFAELRPDLFEC